MSETKTTQQKRPAGVGPMGGGGPAGAMLQGGEKAKNFGQTMRQLAAYMKTYSTKIIAVAIFAIASTVFTIAGPKLLGRMTNVIVDGYIQTTAYNQFTANLPAGYQIPAGTTGESFIEKMPPSVRAKIPAEALGTLMNLDLSQKPSYDYAKLEHYGVILLVLYSLSMLFGYLQGWIMTDVSQQVTYKLRRDIAEKINRLSLGYFDRQTHGEVLSRVTNDVDTVNQTLNQSLSQLITSVTTIIGILVMMLTISWQMTLVALLVLPLSGFLISFIVKRSQRYFKQQQDTLGHLNGHIEEMYGGHQVMKVFNGEKRSVERFVELNNQLHVSAWRSQFLSGLMMPLMTFVGNLNYVGLSVLGGWLAIKGKVSIGDIQAFLQYANQFSQPIVQTANIANVLQSTAASAERVFAFLDEPEQTVEADKLVPLPKVKGAVEFDNVVFGYNPDREVIKHFTAQVKPGQRVAIVGPTGAGKTTVVNLLMRFYDVNSGQIKLDGIETRQLKRAELRQQFGMVLQDTWLFTGSIRDNIMYAKPSATPAEFERATKAAHVDDFVHALPGGYDMIIDEEANNLSQGQKQLITIARAMLADPPLLILDEATSSVDTRTELLIQRAMERLMKGKTSFVIAHRLSTIKDADLILVMKDGNIVEQGTHASLLKTPGGFYANLYNSQFADFDV